MTGFFCAKLNVVFSLDKGVMSALGRKQAPPVLAVRRANQSRQSLAELRLNRGQSVD